MKNFLLTFYSLCAIALCLVLGNLVYLYVGGLPASLYGMIIFAFSLKFQLIKASHVQSTIQWIISHMGVCFVPAGVGIMNHFNIIQLHGISILAITISTTLFLIAFMGLSHKYYLTKKAQR